MGKQVRQARSEDLVGRCKWILVRLGRVETDFHMASENVTRDAEIVANVSPVCDVGCLKVRWNGGSYPLTGPEWSHTERGQREEHVFGIQWVAVCTANILVSQGATLRRCKLL